MNDNRIRKINCYKIQQIDMNKRNREVTIRTTNVVSNVIYHNMHDEKNK